MKSPYIIAEVANSHNGVFAILKELVKKIASSGVPAIKFQIIRANEIVAENHDQFIIFKNLEFSINQWLDIFQFSTDHNLQIWVDVYGEESLYIAKQYDYVHGFKIHTTDVINFPLIEEVGKITDNALISCSGCTDIEVAEAIKCLKKHNNDIKIVLMHGFQSYPTAIPETHLQGLNRLKSVFGLPVGLMDHIDAELPAALVIPIISALYNVEIIEKHVTLSRKEKETDYYSSLTPDELGKMVKLLHSVTSAFGEETYLKNFSPAEQQYAKQVKKKMVASKSLEKGVLLDNSHVSYKRIDKQINSLNYNDIFNKKISHSITPGSLIRYADLDLSIAAIVSVDNHSIYSKNSLLKRINGKEVFLHMIDRIKESKIVNNVYLCLSNSKENEDLFSIGRQHNVECLRLNEFVLVNMMGACLHGINDDVIVHVPGESFFFDTDMIQKGLHAFREKNYDYLMFQGLPKGSDFEIFDRRIFLKMFPYFEKRVHSTKLKPYLNINGYLDTCEIDSGLNESNLDLRIFHRNNVQKMKSFVESGKMNNDFKIKNVIDHFKKDEKAQVIPQQQDNQYNLNIKKLIGQKIVHELPLVTVYITAYNYGRYIDTAIQSVIKQSFLDWELIIVNDGSEDETELILKKYSTHPKITIINQQNKGLTRSSNLAMRSAKGKFIMRLDADDYLGEDALLVMSTHFMANTDLDVVYSDYYMVDEFGEIDSIFRRKKIGIEVELLDLPAHGAGTMFKLDSLKEIGGYDEEIDREDEFDLWVRCHQILNIDNISLPLFYYRQHGLSMTDNQKAIHKTKRKILRKRALVRDKELSVKPSRICIIPIRAHTELSFHSHLLEIGGRTLLDWTMLSAGNLFDQIVVVSEDIKIIEYVKRKYSNIETVLRSEQLARRNVSLRNSIKYCIDEMENNNRHFDEIAVLFIEYPLRMRKHVQQALDTMTLFNLDSVIDVQETYNEFFLHEKHGLSPLFPQKELRLERNVIYQRVGSLMIIKRTNLDSDNHLGEKRGHIRLTPEESYGIHTHLDFKIVETILKDQKERKTINSQ